MRNLYDELTMSSDLRQAHRKKDVAVARAYGFDEILDLEPKIVAELMKSCKEILSYQSQATE